MSETMIANLRQLARYNRWANAGLCAACAELDEAAYKASRAAFFGSIHATLNHILVNDRIWTSRFTGRPCSISALDEELYGSLDDLRAAQDADDAALIDLVDGLDEAGIGRIVRYTTIDDFSDHADPLWLLLVNLFNHQTHHRGQVHDMLSQTTVAPPPLDLIFYVRENAGG
jgi:uncharacterized damage-inducible protein DinB